MSSSLARAIAERVAALSGPRKGAPPAVRKFISDHAFDRIEELSVCREPITSAITTALNFATLGGFSAAKKKMGYDELYHLYMLVRLGGSYYRLEKNQVVVIAKAAATDFRPEICKKVQLGRKIEFGAFMASAAESTPGFWQYDAVHNNCQDFVMTLLAVNLLSTPELKAFVKQTADELLSPVVATIAKKITDIAGAADVVLHGAALSGRAAARSRVGRTTGASRGRRSIR